MEITKLTKGKEPDTRTTCTLTENGNNALTCLMDEFGITQKKIFAVALEQESIVKSVLELAKKTGDAADQRQFRKSLVIAKKDLKSLNAMSKTQGLSRDLIIDSTIRLLALLLNSDKESRIKKHKKALDSLNQLWGRMEKLEKEMAGYLPEDDAIIERYGKVIVVLMNLVHEIEAEMSKGTTIDPEGM
jgi:hypothetical protein